MRARDSGWSGWPPGSGGCRGRATAPDPLTGLPPVWPEPLLAKTIRRRGRDRTVVVLDDDPTGTQTVHDVPVLIDPDLARIESLLSTQAPISFVLTNSRSLPEGRAVSLARALGRRIRNASRRAGRSVSLVSRSDSTLRGHFPAEVDALAEAFGIPDAPVLLMPWFADGGRVTVGDVHYLVRDGVPVPVAETEFARDPAFAYEHSDLRAWVAARPGTAGRAVVSLPLERIRGDGPAWVAEALIALPARAIAIANAVDDRDGEVVALGMVEAERTRPIVARTAAGYVRARAGQARRRELAAGDLRVRPGPGLVVVGSHVPSTTRQVRVLLDDPSLAIEPVELPATAALSPRAAAATRRDAVARATALLERGVTPVVMTSRDRLDAGPDDPSGLRLAARVSSLLVETVQAIDGRPAWVLAKGGITSSDIATRALGAGSATVLGQLLPGVPVWRLRPPGRRPLVYVVFPGNVGDDDALRLAVARLSEAAATPPPTSREPRAGAS